MSLRSDSSAHKHTHTCITPGCMLQFAIALLALASNYQLSTSCRSIIIISLKCGGLLCLEVNVGVYLTMDCDVYGPPEGKDIRASAGF